MSTTFQSFGLPQEILRVLDEIGFVTPTAIQESVMPHIMQGKDVIAKAQTGSGKTAAFCLPALHLMRESSDKKILILAPTRELALQVCKEISQFSKYLKIDPVAVYGGEPIPQQLKRLKNDQRIIVGTPGRLLDLLRSKRLRDFDPSIVILDEADEMLNMGFLEDIQSIFSFLPSERQTLLFSATISSEIRRISTQFLKDPVSCDQASQKIAHADIHQFCYLVPERERKFALFQVLQFHNPVKSIVFCNTKRQVDELSLELAHQGFSTLCLHGDMTQKDREHSIEQYRRAKSKILVATDVAGRGINVTDVTHVFNYELPTSPDAYTHRIGRTGRIGKKGIAITFLSPRQVQGFKRYLPKDSTVQIKELPSFEELKVEQQKRFRQTLEQESIHKEAKIILESLQKEHSLEEISLRLISRYWKKEVVVASEKWVSSPSAAPKKEGFAKKGDSFGRKGPQRGSPKRNFFKKKRFAAK